MILAVHLEKIVEKSIIKYNTKCSYNSFISTFSLYTQICVPACLALRNRCGHNFLETVPDAQVV